MAEAEQFKKKVCLIGDPMVGKTAIVNRFVLKSFDDKYIQTIGVNVSKKDIAMQIKTADNTPKPIGVSLSIWDLVGQKAFRNLTKRHFMNSHGAIMVCDVTRQDTVGSLREWILFLFNCTGPIPLVLIANKSDLPHNPAVITRTLREISNQFEAPFVFTSAKTGDNVEQAFYALSEAMLMKSLSTKQKMDVDQVQNEIIKSFCSVHGGTEAAMPMVNHQFSKVGLTLDSPTKESLIKVVPKLVEVTQQLKGQEIANLEQRKYNQLMKQL